MCDGDVRPVLSSLPVPGLSNTTDFHSLSFIAHRACNKRVPLRTVFEFNVKQVEDPKSVLSIRTTQSVTRHPGPGEFIRLAGPLRAPRERHDAPDCGRPQVAGRAIHALAKLSTRRRRDA